MCDTELKIYNIVGREVQSFQILNSQFSVGSIEWDGCDKVGKVVKPGIYFVRVGDNSSITNKIIFLGR